jgi:hypothetical protein
MLLLSYCQFVFNNSIFQFSLKHFCFRQFYELNLGIFIQRVNPRAKALGPIQNKNAQIQVVKLSKQKVFVKLKNVSDKKIRSCYFTFEKCFFSVRDAGTNASSTEKTLFLRIAHMIFSIGVWKIHKIWIFLIYY